ncbi:MAG: hypothetical protein IKW30_04850 [Lachnospiraceae bacterium]|nr:hypothetical protein [Lachnospiraceae bacterium]
MTENIENKDKNKIRIEHILLLIIGVIVVIFFVMDLKIKKQEQMAVVTLECTDMYNDTKWKQQAYIDDAYLKEILDKRNKEFQIPIKEEGYDTEELEELARSANVLVTIFDSKDRSTFSLHSGFIYDITDSFLYVCIPKSFIIDSEEDWEKENYGIDQMSIKLYTGEEKHGDNPTILIQVKNIRISKEYDLAMVAIPRNQIKESEVKKLHTINVDNLYHLDGKYVTLYSFSYQFNGKSTPKWSMQEVIIETTDVGYPVESSASLHRGPQGAACYDYHGNFYGVLNGSSCNYQIIFPEFYELILDLHPNY